MMTVMLLAAALAGAEPAIVIPPNRRDPFVSPARWARFMADRARRLAYLEERFLAEGFSREEFAALLGREELALYPRIVSTATLEWNDLRANVLAPESVRRGAAYYERHRSALERTEAQSRIRGTAMVALVRIESDLGESPFDPENPQNVVFNVFYTKTLRRGNGWVEETGKFRWQIAADTLAAFAAYCRENGLDPFAVRGSWAGAFGIIQMMPFNVREYGVDGNGDGKINLFDPEDAFPTATRFLVRHGWHANEHEALVAYFGENGSYQNILLTYEEELKKEMKQPRASR